MPWTRMPRLPYRFCRPGLRTPLSVMLWALAALPAGAGCSRSIHVPIAPIGLSVFVDGENGLSGVYPDVLRSAGPKEDCTFEFSVVPRARLDLMYEAGHADLLIPASRSPARDAYGSFVPLIYSRATLISLDSRRSSIRSAQDLLERRQLKVGVVRGFDFGPAYQEVIKALAHQDRLVQDVDAASLARLLQGGTLDLIIMAPSIFVGAIQGDPKLAPITQQLRSEAIDDFPWNDSGAYISKSVGEPDASALRALLERAAKSGAVWRAFLRYYPANVLTGSIRSR